MVCVCVWVCCVRALLSCFPLSFCYCAQCRRALAICSQCHSLDGIQWSHWAQFRYSDTATMWIMSPANDEGLMAVVWWRKRPARIPFYVPFSRRFEFHFFAPRGCNEIHWNIIHFFLDWALPKDYLFSAHFGEEKKKMIFHVEWGSYLGIECIQSTLSQTKRTHWVRPNCWLFVLCLWSIILKCLQCRLIRDTTEWR